VDVFDGAGSRALPIIGEGGPDEPDRASSYVMFLNWELARRDGPEVRIGIGMAEDTALMAKAGFKGSGNNEVVWNGIVVGRAAELCSFGNRTSTDRGFMVDIGVGMRLCDKYRGFLELNLERRCWHTDIVNVGMNDCYQRYCV